MQACQTESCFGRDISSAVSSQYSASVVLIRTLQYTLYLNCLYVEH